MCRSLVVAIVLASLIGCEKQNTPAKKADAAVAEVKKDPVAEKPPTDEKTTDDARKYIQDEIDRYLGGDRTDKYLTKLDPTGEATVGHIGDKINSITITNVLPAYTEKGEKWKNAFKVTLIFTGETWTKTVQRHVQYVPKKGVWLVF